MLVVYISNTVPAVHQYLFSQLLSPTYSPRGSLKGCSAESFVSDRLLPLFFPPLLSEIHLTAFRLNFFLYLKKVRQLGYVMLFPVKEQATKNPCHHQTLCFCVNNDKSVKFSLYLGRVGSESRTMQPKFLGEVPHGLPAFLQVITGRIYLRQNTTVSFKIQPSPSFTNRTINVTCYIISYWWRNKINKKNAIKLTVIINVMC